MTNSNEKSEVSRILQELFGLLGENTIQKQIDEPIRKAAGRFEYRENVDDDFSGFVERMGRFLQHLFKEKASTGRHLSHQQAQEEAMTILDAHYIGGVYVAYLDCRGQTSEGISQVVDRFTEIMIQIDRQKYINWVYAKKIEPLKWQAKRRLVSLLQNYFLTRMPPDLRNCPPEMLVPQLLSLINTHLKTKDQVTNIAAGDKIWRSSETTGKILPLKKKRAGQAR